MTEQIDTNSKRTRIEPVFRWLKANAGADWPAKLLGLAEGFIDPIPPGRLLGCDCDEEVNVPPSATRLAWMIRNASRLAASDGRNWREYARRVLENGRKEDVLAKLDRGDTASIPRELVLERETFADCLIRTEHAIIWIEGKRNDWISTGTKWDVARDQLARNVEAAWILATLEGKKDYRVIICHEYPLKHHEEQLVQGYRAACWNGGWPHLSVAQRKEFSGKIGTLTWSRIKEAWPGLGQVPVLRDIVGAPASTPPAKANTVLVFAYGSNLDMAQMSERCPSVRFSFLALLRDHELKFTRTSTGRRCGVADVVPKPGGEVWGVVYEIAVSDLPRLDENEGYSPGRAGNAYERRAHVVHVDGAQDAGLEVQIYFANPQSDPLPPNSAYKALIVRGAKAWQLPERYVHTLEEIPTHG